MISDKKKKEVEKKYSEFADEVAGMDVERLEMKLLIYAKQAEIIDDERDRIIGDKVKNLKDEIKLLEQPYKDAKKANALKRSYLVSSIEEKGGNVGK